MFIHGKSKAATIYKMYIKYQTASNMENKIPTNS